VSKAKLEIPEDLNRQDVRLVLEGRMMMRNVEVDGKRTMSMVTANTVTIELRNERDRWVKALGPIVATDEKPAGEASYADLLDAVARILRSQEVPA
jgi:hypothetical protein